MFFYEPLSATAIVSVLLYLVFLIGMNELSRLNKWVGAAIFIALPLALTIFVWPHTAVEGTGAGTWFQWVKTYSCLAGAILGWLIVYFPAFQKKYIVCIPPIIFAINILEACIRDFQLTGVNGIVDGYMVVGGPWNVVNGIAPGILNALCICGFFGIIVGRQERKTTFGPTSCGSGLLAMTCGTSPTPTTAFPIALCIAAWCFWRRARFPRSSLSAAPMLSTAFVRLP